MPRRRVSESNTSPGRSPKRSKRLEKRAESREKRNKLLGNDISGRIKVVSDAEYLATAKALKEIDEDIASELRPVGIQLYPHENKHAHHTEDYELEDLVLRRGQDFDMAITFNRPYDKKMDTIVLQFATCSRPKESKGSLIRVNVKENCSTLNDNWQAKLVSSEDNTIELRIATPPDAIIGKYQVFVETKTVDGDDTHCVRKEFSDVIIIICNPFCSGDVVYIESEEKRQEYVMNEMGLIWQGTTKNHHAKPWNYGQFESVSLEAALYILDKAELQESARSNVVEIIKTISKMSNSEDEDAGILEGLWSDEYPGDCTLPWAWTGSVEILTQYMASKKSVKYGQCWVFSGLVTTLCRALGIPTRSVTNFESAHDTDASMTIDFHWNEEDEPIDKMNDSVWNFHVWNESWFLRPDLPEGFDGWQAHDATPQESSEGVMKCGPSPVAAIREGKVYLPYDTKFIFAEVNGDKVHWLVRKDGSSEVLGIDKSAIGHHISTKAVGQDAREDITLQYKYEEGSIEERNCVHRAFRYSSRKESKVYDIKEPDVKFDLISPEKVTLGEDFKLEVKLKNITDEKRSVHMKISAVASFYTGVPSKHIASESIEETLEPNQAKTVSLPVTGSDYIQVLKPDSIVTVYLKGTVVDTGLSYAHIDKIAITNPEILVSVPEKVALNEEFEVVLHVTNPLQEKLTGARFHIEASRGIKLPFIVPYKKAIGPEENISVTLKATASRSGNREIIANFVADQVPGMFGKTSIYVSYAE